MLLPILAEASDKATWSFQWPQQNELLTWCQNMMPGTAMLLIVLGIIYLLFGYKIIKVLVILNALVLGAAVGAVIGHKGEAAIACAIIGAFAAAAIAWPAMKYAVALMGGLVGAMLGGIIWHAAALEPNLAWAGALVGLVGFGLLSFILFRGSVMMYTSLQGAVMLVFGVLGLMYKYQDIAPKLNSHLRVEPFLLPAAVFLPAMIGLIFQQHQTSPGGGGAGGGGHGGGGKK
ncbi:MAG: DUF4203 domain-containing protein [Tepidisphaeraceae bacterium]|jgi:hypothetical protein